MSQPSEIARETLRLLAQRHLPPTPDNYRTLYQEIAGTNRPGAVTAPEPRDLLVYVLDTAIGPILADAPKLQTEAKNLAADIRLADIPAQLQDCHARLKRFAYHLEVRAEDHAEMREGLLKLIRLLMENVGGMVSDDQWLQGQLEIIRNIVDKPLSLRTIEDAERRLKEVVYKQSRLEQGLDEAKGALKNMLTGFVDQLADLADTTSGYHDKIEAYAGRIANAPDVGAIGGVLAQIMQETQSMQQSAQRSRDELRLAQDRVRVAEARIVQLETELAATSNLVRYDQLTGVLNRRGMEEMFQKEMARATRHENPLCVALLDIDNFKKINDSMGHDVGDLALTHLASLCRNTLRPQDTVARYGGEEFVILLPDTGIEDAVRALSRLQRELTRHFFMHNNERVLVTFSAGVTQLQDEDSQAVALKRADAAMYQAKQQGKNRVLTG